MGVNGLWQVVQPCARPTNLATLNRKRLAVDASIWIYQFLKAVRDKEGHALRNSHVVGFFRRICKLLWFGIKPVFVFDGAAPALKRQTVAARKRRREGRREDAARTAGKLLAVQMHRRAEEEAAAERRRKQQQRESAGKRVVGAAVEETPHEAIPDVSKLVYADEIGMTPSERVAARRFHRQDAYHLPELDANAMTGAGRPEDPRVMSVEELEEYARQFHEGEDVNLYDFSKIDFDGDFFRSLPPPDRYNILNAARLRSRLRMGLSKEQLDGMFPDRMAFSRFQVERVQERNRLTQRLMYEVGMTGLDLTIGNGAGRIAGDRNREYILVKNEGAEGGWALGVVSRDKEVGKTAAKAIDIDALHFQFQQAREAAEEEWEDEDEDFEDVPVEGLNRLPKLSKAAAEEEEEEEGLFVEGVDDLEVDDALFEDPDDDMDAEELAELNRAIAMSLQDEPGVDDGGGFLLEDDVEEDGEPEDVPAPEWTQQAVEPPRPIVRASGRMVAHIVNNRSNAAVPKRRESAGSSDSDMDFGAMLAAARKKKQAEGPPKPKPQPRAPILPNVKNPFDGPLPFEALDWRRKGGQSAGREDADMEPPSEDDADDLEGGFERVVDGPDAPRELPPWLADNTDIREALEKQKAREDKMNEDDRALAMAEEQAMIRRQREAIIEIESSDDDGSDVEIIEAPSPPPKKQKTTQDDVGDGPEKGLIAESTSQLLATPHVTPERPVTEGSDKQLSSRPIAENRYDGELVDHEAANLPLSPSPEPEFEDVELPAPASPILPDTGNYAPKSPVPFPVPPPVTHQDDAEVSGIAEDGIARDDEFDDFSDAEDEELMAQMAEEAEEHARFSSQLNHKPESLNLEEYERELKALRSQQRNERRDADEVTQIMIAECQSLLRLFGIPYITAPMEAEAQCAELVRLGLVDGVVTDDSDIFLFGGTRVYKNMFNGNKLVECYLATDLEKEMSLSRRQLVSIAQLLGSDYTEGVAGVGPVTAVEILSEFPGDAGLAEFRDWWDEVQARGRPAAVDAASPFRRRFRRSQAAKLFLPVGFPSPAVVDAYLRPEVDHSAEEFRWGVPDLELLRRFLMDTIGWGPERTDEVLVPVIRDMNKREIEGTQSNITRFFAGSVGAGARQGQPVAEAFAPRTAGGKAKGSKRMAEAVSRLRSTTKAAAAAAGGEASSAERDPDATSTAAAAAAGVGGGSSADVGTAEGSKPAAKRKRKPRRAAAAVLDEEDSDDQYTESVGGEGQAAKPVAQKSAKGKRARARPTG